MGRLVCRASALLAGLLVSPPKETLNHGKTACDPRRAEDQDREGCRRCLTLIRTNRSARVQPRVELVELLAHPTRPDAGRRSADVEAVGRSIAEKCLHAALTQARSAVGPFPEPLDIAARESPATQLVVDSQDAVPV